MSAQDEAPDGPAVISILHRRDRETSPVAGSPKAWRRYDGLGWLHRHKAIANHQLAAGRRLQEDWQISKIEASPRMVAGGGGSVHGVLSDAALDAGQRVRAAMAVVPSDSQTVLCLFLMPEDHPLSMQQIGLMVKRDWRGVSKRIKKSLTLLARHYGYG